MATVAEALQRHGVTVDEDTLAAEVEARVAALLPAPGGAGLPARDRELLAAGGLHLRSEADRSGGGAARHAAAAAADYAALLATGLTARAAAELFVVDTSRVRQLVAAGRIWALRGVAGRHVIPRAQLVTAPDGSVRPTPHLDQVLAALPTDLHPLEVVAVLTVPQADLELDGQPRSVVEWLAAGGEPARAVAVAAAVDVLQ